MEYIIGFVFGLFVYRFLLEVEDHLRSKRIERLSKEIMDKYREMVVPSKIEKIDNRFFMYNRDTNEFLAHGKDYEELEENARIKYPNKMFDVPKEELALFDK